MGRKNCHRIFWGFSSILLFISASGALADSDFGTELFSVLIIENGRLGTQGASLFGALAIDGNVYSTQGLAGNQSGTDVPLLSPTDDGGLCIGDCTGTATTTDSTTPESGQEPDIPAAPELTDVQSSGSTSITTSAFTSSVEDVQTNVASSNETLQGESETVEAMTTELIDNSPPFISSYSRSYTNDSPNHTETDDKESPTATSTEQEPDLPTDPTLNPLEQFLAWLQEIVTLKNGNLGINNADPQHALSVTGWIYSSLGYLFGDLDDPIGIGMTSDGICLGSCDFSLPLILAQGNTPESQARASLIPDVDTETGAESSSTKLSEPDTEQELEPLADAPAPEYEDVGTSTEKVIETKANDEATTTEVIIEATTTDTIIETEALSTSESTTTPVVISEDTNSTTTDATITDD